MNNISCGFYFYRRIIMRIYICGGHSCGKSTIARYISEKYKIPMIKEVARMILSEKELHLDTLRTNLDVVDSYQEQVFLRQFEEEAKIESFVSDRSFDNLAYMAQHSRILNKYINDKNLLDYIDSLKKDDVIMFFIRPSKATMKADGVRESLNWDSIIAIDSMIKFLLEMFGLSYVSINTDSMQERIRIVESVIKYSNKI